MWFDKIKRYYDTGVWNKTMVWHSVGKGKISTEDYEAITGETYVPGEMPTTKAQEYLGYLSDLGVDTSGA